MAIRYLSLITATVLLATAAAAQDQTTSTSSSSVGTTDTTTSTSSATGTAPAGQEALPTMGTTRDVEDTTQPRPGNATSGSDPGTTGSPVGTTGTSTPPATPPMNTTGTGGTTGTTMSGSTSSTGTLGGATATTGTSSTLQGQDAMFLQKAAQSGREEVADAQLALQNAQRSETKSVAQMMMDDHKRSNDQLQQLAGRKGWTMPSAGSAESDQSRDLASGGKSDFDQRYITEEIRDHRDAIAAFRTEATSGSDPDLRQFARDNLPALEHHLEMLQGASSQK